MGKIFSALKFFVIFFIGSILFFCFSGVSFAQSSIRFKEIYYDFGEIDIEADIGADRALAHNFEFKNTGVDTLTVTGVRSSCGCVATNLTDKDLQPGDEGKIEVLFRPNNREVVQERSIFVHSNDPDFPVIKLSVRAAIGKQQ